MEAGKASGVSIINGPRSSPKLPDLSLIKEDSGCPLGLMGRVQPCLRSESVIGPDLKLMYVFTAMLFYARLFAREPPDNVRVKCHMHKVKEDWVEIK